MTDTAEKTTPSPERPTGFLREALEFVVGPLTGRNAMTWVRFILFVVTIQWLLIEPFRIPSGSMEPTFFAKGSFFGDDRVAVNKLAYGLRMPFTEHMLFSWSAPKRWDIVVFRSVDPPPADAGPIRKALWGLWPKVLIKRVVGLPGERIHIQDGRVYANGEPLELPPSMPPVQYTSATRGYEDGVAIVRSGLGRLDVVEDNMRYGVRAEDEFSVVPKGSYLVLGDNSGNSADGRYFGWVPASHMLGRAFGIWWPLSRRRDLSGFSETWWGALLLYGIPAVLVLYELLTGFVVRSWRVRAAMPDTGLRRGDRLRVNCLAFGLRLPFSRRRLTAGRRPKTGELVVYRAPEASEWQGAHLLGKIAAVPGDEYPRRNGKAAEPATEGTLVPDKCYFIDSAEGEDYPDSRVFDCVRCEDLDGNVVSIWWPLGRRTDARSIGAGMAPR